MSLKCMPLLFLNLGSEMIYILQHRLMKVHSFIFHAQNIGKEKATQVLRDISYILFNTKFLNELCKPQYICSKLVIRTFFEKVAHSSIMRLNKPSMDKLYALMMMTYKYQLQLCNGPENIVFITLNHLDCVRQILPKDEKLKEFLDLAHRIVIVMYHAIPLWEKAMIRSYLLNFFQDLRMNVSIFVREKKQTEEGQFILYPDSNYQLVYKGNPPGTIKYFDNDGKVQTESFIADENNAITYKSCNALGNVELNAENRGTTLGTNMYVSSGCLQIKGNENIMKPEASLQEDELRLLSALIVSPEQNQQKGFDLNLFTDETDEQVLLQQEQDNTLATVTTTHIDARKSRKTITAAVADLKMDEPRRQSKKGEEILNLLDEATNYSDI